MMKMRLICFGLLLNCLVYHTYAQTFICSSIPGYDIKPLTTAVQWQVTTDYDCLGKQAGICTYYISFCQIADMCPNHEYSACQNTTGASNMTIIGGYTNHPFYENESGPKGFYAKFPNGPLQNISNTTECEPSLTIKFNCDSNAIWLVPLPDTTGFAPQPTDIYIDSSQPCATIMTFDYAGACQNGQDPIKNKGISAGAIFMIILFSSALVYFIVGTIYNGLVKHRSGINLLPHAQFWIGLPLYAIEGCRATLTCCSGTPKPSQATYESV